MLFVFAAVLFCFIVPARAGEPMIWETGSRAELLQGEARGVSISDAGTLTLAPRFDEVYNTQQTFVWSSVTDPRGNVFLGTGHDGRLFRVAPNGTGALAFDAPELDITALAVGRDGSVYAGTSPDGKVYRLDANGRSEVFFDPPDKYIWSLAVWPDGAIAVGTGDKGKIYRLTRANQTPEQALLTDTAETNIIALAVDAKGQLMAGTDPGGVVLRIGLDGKTFALYDAPLREIHALVPAPNGALYVLAVGAAAASEESGDDAKEEAKPVSRYDLSGAKSAVLRLTTEGVPDVLWKSNSVTGFALVLAPAGGVYLGTSEKGRIYAISDEGRDTLLVQSDTGQIATFAWRGKELLAASSSPGKLFRMGTGNVESGSYESPVHDAKLLSAWGRLWWRGAGQVEIQTRSGNTGSPDATWSEWSAPATVATGAPVTSPGARFIQWRAILKRNIAAGGVASQPRLDEVSLAYLPRNIAPEVLSVTVQPSGVALLGTPATVDPNIVASGLDPALFGVSSAQAPRPAFQKGARTLRWQAEDRNGDKLEYAIYFRSIGETTFRLLSGAEFLAENYYTLDGAAFADGRYVFKVVASDTPSNPPDKARTGERTTEPIDLDNTPPVVKLAGPPAITGNRAQITLEADDGNGRIKGADANLDGSVWRPVAPDDEIADSPRERFTVVVQLDTPGEHVIALRVFDANGNVGTIRVPVKR